MLQTEDIKSPTPTIASKEINIDTKNRKIFPTNGIWKNVTIIPTIIIVKARAIINGENTGVGSLRIYSNYRYFEGKILKLTDRNSKSC